MNKNELVTVLQAELARAKGRDDELAARREEALNYYNGKMGEPSEGNSNIVSMDVADGVHAIMASLEPLIHSTNIDFIPNGMDDEPQAQAESSAVHYVVQKNDGYATIFSAIHDGLLMGNGWINVDINEEVKVQEQNYPKVPPEALFMLSQPQVEDEEVEVEETEDGYRIVRSTPSKELEMRVVPPENIMYSDEEGVADVQKLRFIAERKVMTKSDLLELGVPASVVEEQHGTIATLAAMARTPESINTEAVQTSEQAVEVFRCFIKLDKKNDHRVHKTELHEVWMVGDHIISDNLADFIPYITGTPLPLPHRLEGQGVFTLLKNVQEAKTHILREYLDNLSVANLGRVGAVEGQVNMTDLTNGRKSGVVRMRQQGAVQPLPFADIGPQSMNGLQYFDKVRTDRIGTSVDFNEVQAQIMQSSAMAAMGQMANAEKMVALYARNFVETLLKPLFKLTHYCLRSKVAGPIFVKARGKWMQQDTTAWPARTHVNSTMGLTTIDKATRLQALNSVIAMQTQLWQMGADNILVDLNSVYNALMDQLRAQNIDTPEEYYMDPMSEEAQQAMQEKAEAAQQEKQEMVQLQQQMEQMKHQFEMEKQARDIEYKRWSDELKADIEEAKLIAQKTK